MQEMNNWRNITSASIVIDDEIWFSNDTYNGLFKVNTKTGKVRFVDFFPEEEFEKKFMHRCVLKYQDLLIFSPWCSDHAHIFDMKNKTFHTVFIQRKYNESIAGMHVINNILYLIPVYTKQPMIALNLSDFSENKIDFRTLKNGNAYCDSNADTSAKTNTIIYENKIWFAQQPSNKLYALDISKMEIQSFATEAETIFSLSLIGDSIYISPYEKKEVFKYQIKNNNIYQLKDFKPEDNIYGNRYFVSHVVEYMGEIIAVPGYASDIMWLKNDAFELLQRIDDMYDGVKKMKLPMFFNSHVVNEQLWLMPFAGKKLIVIDKNMKVIEKRELYCEDEKDIEILNNNMFHNAKLVEEGVYVSLKEWLKNF